MALEVHEENDQCSLGDKQATLASKAEQEATPSAGPQPKAEGNIMEEETMSLYISEKDNSPRVDIVCFGVPTSFCVDTGSDLTCVSRTQVREWGQQHQL